MNKYLKVFAIFISITATAVVFASANIAPQAKTLRKTYTNGDYSEVECQDRVDSKGRFACLFRRHEDIKLSTFSFDLYDYGYDHMSVTDQFTYWPSGGGVAFSVGCTKQDIDLLKKNDGLILNDVDTDLVKCRIFLYPVDDALKAERVEINYYTTNGNSYDATREITSNSAEP